MTDRGRLWKRAALAVGATLVCLVGAELVLRAAGIEAPRWTHANHLEAEDKRAVIDAYPDDPRGYFDLDLRDAAVRARWAARGIGRLDEVQEATPHAVGLRFDENLCRSDSGVPSGEGALVLVVGDSFAEGQGVRGRDTFSAVLDRALGPLMSVVNCGRRGYDFPRLAESLEARLDAYSPDVVLYAMVLNDAARSAAFSGRQPYLNDWIVDRRRMLASATDAPSAFVPRLWAVLADRTEGARVGAETMRWYLDMYGPENAEGWAATQNHVADMGAATRERGASFVVALLPLLVDLDGAYPLAELSPIIASAFEDRGVAFHDTTAAFLGRPAEDLWVHPMDRHPNEVAHRIIADDLEPVLRSILEARR